MAKYENPIEHSCDVREGQSWISIDGERTDSLMREIRAWICTLYRYLRTPKGKHDFFDYLRAAGWIVLTAFAAGFLLHAALES